MMSTRRLGHFDPPGPLDAIPKTAIADDYAVSLSLDGAAQSAVLVKNAAETLPWDRGSVGTVVAAAGWRQCHTTSKGGYC